MQKVGKLTVVSCFGIIILYVIRVILTFNDDEVIIKLISSILVPTASMPFFAIFALRVISDTKKEKPPKARTSLWYTFCMFAVWSAFLSFGFLMLSILYGFGTTSKILNYLLIPYIFVECIYSSMFSLSAGMILNKVKKGQPINKYPFTLSIIGIVCGSICVTFPAMVFPSINNLQWIDFLYLACCAVVLFDIIDKTKVHKIPEEIKATKL